jgi:hypothetical protein
MTAQKKLCLKIWKKETKMPYDLQLKALAEAAQPLELFWMNKQKMMMLLMLMELNL